MKLLFFLLAVVLVLLRGYLSVINHGPHSDDNDGTMTISSGDYYAQIKWSGKIELSEDENSIKRIPPGGYLKFRENDRKLVAEANLKGEITYQLYDGSSDLPLNDSGQRFISAAIKKMIGWGYNAGGRAERINRKAGYKGLMEELPNLKMENSKGPYLDLLFANDSLKKETLAAVVKQIANSVTDIDKENYLGRITPAEREDSLVSAAYLDITRGINADIQKVTLLLRLIESDSLSTAVFDRTMDITEHFNSDIDKQTIYNKLSEKRHLREDRWIRLIEAAAAQQADVDKSNMLVRIAQLMPRTDSTKAAYLTAARKINNDADYGRAVKIIP